MVSIIAVLCISGLAFAQGNGIGSNFSAGFQLNEYGDDFGLGINLTSPFFANERAAFRVKGNYMFFEHVEDGETIWTPYTTISLGSIGVAGTIADFVRLYGEGGALLIFPAEEFSSEDIVSGGYGLFGFEFFMNENGNYFIEIGGVGADAKADKLPASPLYSTGMLISAGYRIIF